MTAWALFVKHTRAQGEWLRQKRPRSPGQYPLSMQYPVNYRCYTLRHCEEANEETIELSVIWDTITLTTRQNYNEWIPSWFIEKQFDV